MYSTNDLTAEIKEIIMQVLESDMPVSSEWISTAILNRHEIPKIVPENDRDFWMICGSTGVKARVRTLVGSLKSPIESIQMEFPEMVMPGYRHLQRGYLVGNPEDSDAPPLLTRIDRMTIDQIYMKIAEMEKQISGLSGHIDELRRLIRTREMAG